MKGSVFVLIFIAWLLLFFLPIYFLSRKGRKKPTGKDQKKPRFPPSDRKKDDTFTDPTYKGLGYNIYD